MNDEQQPYVAPEYADGPLPNRLTRGTLIGCVGLAGVLALPLMLFLPLETWGLPRWAFLVAQLLGFGAFGGGIWLLARVPSTARTQSNDPLHPLTARGAADSSRNVTRARPLTTSLTATSSFSELRTLDS